MIERNLNIQGDIVAESRSGLSIHNRAFKYGDGLFETIRVAGGKPLFLDDHFSRLSKGMKLLQFDIPDFWDLGFCRKEIQKLLNANNIVRGGRIRLNVFRRGEGMYVPKSNEFGFVIEALEGEPNEFILNDTGLNLGIYDEIRIAINILSPLKTVNCLPYIMAGMFARNKSFDDVILLNERGNLCEAVSSNIFLMIDGILYTPSLKDGCTAGIMRRKIIQIAKKQNIALVETSISPDLLNDASELFLTNAIAGIRWVKAWDKKRYFRKTSEKLIAELNKLS